MILGLCVAVGRDVVILLLTLDTGRAGSGGVSALPMSGTTARAVRCRIQLVLGSW